MTATCGRTTFEGPNVVVPTAALEIKRRTLTNLYNERPHWLLNIHRELDSAVATAYGWSNDISDEDALANLLQLNLARTGSINGSA